MDNLKIYEAARAVPQEAQKPIPGGRLKGMTDINPVWRIKKLTELFGPCGVGWWYEVTNKWQEADVQSKQIAAFVDILLYYVDPETGAESHGIPGTGGSLFVSQERGGAYTNDECYKMALTDAISVAAKALGVGADVYWAKGCETKYSAPPAPPESPAPPKDEPIRFICADCHKTIKPWVVDGKTKSSVRQIAQASEKKFGRRLCIECGRKVGTPDENPD